MNKNRKHYIKPERKGQIIFIVCILLAVVIGLAWVMIEDANDTTKWLPVAEYPMTNVNISWLQTHHAGGWNNAGT